MSLDKTNYFNELYTVYKSLLTSRQRDIYELYYFTNLTLGEISEEIDITRQAVKACLDTVCVLLEDYEHNLSLNKKIIECKCLLKDNGSEVAKKIISILEE